MFSFLAADTPVEGDLPKGSGLDTFIRCQREIVLSLTLAPTRNKRKGGGNAIVGDSPDERNCQGGAEASANSHRPFVGEGLRAAGRAGEARLGLEQFRNDHIRKV